MRIFIKKKKIDETKSQQTEKKLLQRKDAGALKRLTIYSCRCIMYLTYVIN